MKIANVLISDSWGDVSPEALERGIGGREGALIYLSREWARLGHNVSSFVNIKSGRRFEEATTIASDRGWYGYHEYLPLSLTKPMLSNFDWDIAIAWECPSVFDESEIKDRVKIRMTEMQVAHLSTIETRALEENCHYLAVLSSWAGDLLLHDGTNMSSDKVVVFPNGVDIDRYPIDVVNDKLDKPIGKSPKFVYSSSPDRGLWNLLKSWPYIREEFPEAELNVCYGVKSWTSKLKWAHSRPGEMAVGIDNLIEQPGVTNLGKIGQDKLANLQLEADAWIYPLDSIQSTETGCITAVENAAAGNAIITTDCDCMKDEFQDISTIVQMPFRADAFAKSVIDTLKDNDLIDFQRRVGRAFAENRNWSIIAKDWTNFFEEVL